ncbi:DnaB-like helicase N-terminal domain-containing protein [Variovorax sp. CAN15]
MWDRVGDLVEEADFFRQEHRLVFQAISSLLNACKPPSCAARRFRT